MSNDEPIEMPWAGILKLTAEIAGAAFLILTGVAVAGVRQERQARADAERVRWTDRNRWE